MVFLWVVFVRVYLGCIWGFVLGFHWGCTCDTCILVVPGGLYLVCTSALYLRAGCNRSKGNCWKRWFNFTNDQPWT